ncbi:nonsense-mediated mRNA decay factor SMG9-like [Neocloeon triangulifer]|uniref:nonsense-mediated mRNA decay factor SMG9-like n=1 Tax=Neocloeon triangulifer TaxID=2078957 RepID=UPI00286FA116|nr:nonsense-mediated mRNA decay factor SMG9-like [Neocloeon triangulifer]
MDSEKYREKKFKKSYFKKQQQNKDVEMKQPTILVREHAAESSEATPQQQSTSASNKTTTIIVKSRDVQEIRAVSPVVNQIKDVSSKPNSSSACSTQPIYQLAAKPPLPTTTSNEAPSQLQSPPLMLSPVKLLDECLQVCDGPLEYLMDQNDFLVVGVIGPQGCGKSFILSELAASPGIFRSEAPEIRAAGAHCSVGVDMYVTPARVIFLDTQPLFSASLMECMAGVNEKKFSTDASVAENSAEISDLHLIAFLLSVCHVVIYVDDWFLNLDVIRYIRDAEMLKLSTSSMFINDVVTEYFPTLVIVKNNAAADDFKKESRAKMEKLVQRCFQGSKLKIDSRCCYNYGKATLPEERQSSVFLLPFYTNKELNFCGHVSYENLITSLRQQIQSTPKQNITALPISERHWYHHACKVMENIKKGNLFMEYSRLLT